MNEPFAPGRQNGPPTLRRQVFELLEGGSESRAGKACDTAIVLLILLNAAAVVAESVPALHERYARQFHVFEVISVAIFTIEYVLRLWTAVEMPHLRRLPAWQARWRLARTPALLIDLAATLPFYLGPLVGLDLRLIRVLRLIRFLKLMRYSPAIHTILRVLDNERRSLMAAGLLLLGALLFTATGMYYIEGHAQPDKFGSIPSSAYWAMTTLTTVGYGDLVPVTPMGRLWAMFTMVLGLCTLSLPVAIIATGFAQEVGRRDFVINWSLMSRIPLFADLDAVQVADLMPLLHAKELPPRSTVISSGSAGDAIYFVASGEISTRGASPERSYRSGDVFGLVSMLEGEEHPNDFVARSRVRLLRLDREDFRRLEQSTPQLGELLRRLAADRRFQRSTVPSPPAPPTGGDQC